MTEDTDRHKSVALYIAEKIPPEDTSAVKAWLVKLMEIREANLPAHWKARAAITATIESKVALRLVKVIAKQSKTLGWDNRTIPQRIGLSAAAVGIALFGGQSAGIAALGTAIGLPLWVVLGAGSMFAKYLYDELAGSPKGKAKATHDGDDEGIVIDVAPVKSGHAPHPRQGGE